MFSGRIQECKGVIAFKSNLSACEAELRSVLEDWIFVGLKLGHEMPITYKNKKKFKRYNDSRNKTRS